MTADRVPEIPHWGVGRDVQCVGAKAHPYAALVRALVRRRLGGLLTLAAAVREDHARVQRLEAAEDLRGRILGAAARVKHPPAEVLDR